MNIAPFFRDLIRRVGPGLALSIGVALAATLLERLETHLFGRAWLESLVLAILLGSAARSVYTPSASATAGIDFAAKQLLEVAVVLLGLSISAQTILAAGPMLIVGIAAVVVLAIAASYAIGRLAGLPHKLSILIACGNSICGNSAIAATAPVISADGDDVAASIAFTAVLGVIVVLAIPPLTAALGLGPTQSGIFAGLTVYAVPQVLAATAPIGTQAVQIGTLVKLVRVLMLGPVLFGLAFVTRMGKEGSIRPHEAVGNGRTSGSHLLPWFVVGFIAMIAWRSSGLVPHDFLQPAAQIANLLTVVAMAALGLSVDVRTVATAGSRVVTTVVTSLIALAVLSLGLLAALRAAGWSPA